MKLFEFIKILQRVKNQEREVYFSSDDMSSMVVTGIHFSDKDTITIGYFED